MTSHLIITLKNGCRWIKFNNPPRKNAFDRNVYETLAKTLNTDASNDDIVATILTGSGDYYSSGFDIKSAVEDTNNGIDGFSPLNNMIQAFINYPKILIALVNGPAIGIAVTTAALCDVIYASDRATFHTPFVHIGLCAEGTSSYNFPRILGRSKASEMLLLGEKITAREAYDFGFVSKVVPHEKFEEFGLSLERYGRLPVNTVKVNKRLVMEPMKKILCACCDDEMKQLKECMDSQEFTDAIVRFLSRKNSKL